MPKTVDHELRREELLEAVWRVVARDGLEGATVRGMARETGWSVGVLSHYFKDKDDILRSALELALQRIEARWETQLADLGPLEALRALVLDNLPLDDERELETKFLMNYWSRAIREDVPQPRRRGPELIDRLTALIEQGVQEGEIATEVVPEDAAEILLGLIDGFSLHSLLDPERLSPERQVALVEGELDRLSSSHHSGLAPCGAAPSPRRAQCADPDRL
jgi:AcrR family transcriptional regulator